MATRLQVRRGTAAAWAAASPVLAEGEIGAELDTGKWKLGNGSQDWNHLAYSTGPQGVSGSITLGTVQTGTPGSFASITNSGTSQNAIFNFTIPRGDKGEKGDTGTLSVGTVTTSTPGSTPTVINSGTSTTAIFDFTIPRGDTGRASTIAIGTVSTTPGAYASVSNTGSNTDAVFDFSLPAGQGVPLGGSAGQFLIKTTSADYDAAWETQTIFNGYATPIGGANAFRYQASTPTSANAGDFWFDSESALLYININDGDSAQWVQVGGGAVSSAKSGAFTMFLS